MSQKIQSVKIRLSVLAITTSLLPTLGAAWSGYNRVTILDLTTYQAPATAGISVKFSPATPNLEGCSYTTGDYAWIDTTQADGKAVYASILAAYLAGRSVDIGVHGCASNGTPRVYGISIAP
jgi:hypothetical protein